MLTTTSGDGTAADLFAFTSDGLVIDAGGVRLKSPAPSNKTPITIRLGVWTHAAGGGVKVTFVELGAGKNGALQGILTITAHVTRNADGNSFQGT
jgi:hypothetical protein